MWLHFTKLCVLFVGIAVSTGIQDKCTPNEEIAEGRCTVIDECEDAIRSLKVNHSQPFRRCGFEGYVEVVCCPTQGRLSPQPINTPTAAPPKATTDVLLRGDKCVPSDEFAEGRCVFITDCYIAMRALAQNVYKPLSRCCFEGLVEVVCCPTEDRVLPQPPETTRAVSTTSTTSSPLRAMPVGTESPQRTADRECRKIKDSIPPRLDVHIIGGEIVEAGEFPHMVALGYTYNNGYDFRCGGSLISSSFVLTAAHCVSNRDMNKPKIVRMDAIDISGSAFDESTDYRVAAYIVHPKYRSNRVYHDIALLRLEKEVQFQPFLYPACLYTSDSDPQIDLIVTGWGKTNASVNTRSQKLLKANVGIVENSICRTSYASTRRLPTGIMEGQLCAGDENGLKDTCQGDSGGPLQGFTGGDSFYRIVGVTSFGRSCGGREPGVYARVSHYLDWIESQVWPN